MDTFCDSLSTFDLMLQVALLLEILFHPSNCLSVIFNWQAFYMTMLVEKLMYFTSAGWVDLPCEAAERIKQCFQSRCLATKVEIHGVPVVANLLGMVMVDSDGQFLSIAWIDNTGKTFFPKKIFGCNIQRFVPTPADPSPALGSLEDLQRLEESDYLYKKVRKTFLVGIKEKDPGAKVTAVYMCTHSSAHAKSRLRAFEWTEEMTKTSLQKDTKRYGWYGTSATRVEGIISGGFGLEDAHLGGGVFGSGIYLTPRDYSGLSAYYSKPDANGEYHLMLCQVIMGRVEQVRRHSTQYLPSTNDFDNGINDLRNPRWLIIWASNMITHIIPRYVVSFKVSKLREVHWRRKHLQVSCLRGLIKPIPLRSSIGGMVPRCPHYLARYHKNKNHLP